MITSLHIKNFKALKENTFELANLNLLTGLNGMGKSSLIQTLLLLRQSYVGGYIHELRLRGELCDIGGQDKVLYYKAEDNILTFDLELKKDNQAYQYKHIFEIDKKSDSPEIDSFFEKLSPNLYLKEFTLFNNYFQYISAERIKPTTSHKRNNDWVEKTNQISKEKGQCEYAINYLVKKQRNLIPFFNMKHHSEEGRSLIQQVNAWMGEISPNIRIKAREEARNDEYILEYQYNLSNEQQTPDFTPENVGFGISYSLPIVIALLTAQADDLIIIENPESHLHPQGQSKLAELMCLAAQNGVQIFCETHSDHIFYGTRVAIKEGKIQPENAKTYYFTRNEQDHSAITDFIEIDKRGKIGNAPKGFFDQFRINQGKLL